MSNSKILKDTIEASTDNPSESSDAKPGKEQAFFLIRLIQEPVVPQDVYSIAEVSKLLNMSRNRVHYFSTIKDNPLPIRKLSNGARGSFVFRDELIEWLKYNSVKPEESKPRFQKFLRYTVRITSVLLKIITAVHQVADFVFSLFQVGL